MKWNLNSSVSVQSLNISLYLYSRKACREKSYFLQTRGKKRADDSLKFFSFFLKKNRVSQSWICKYDLLLSMLLLLQHPSCGAACLHRAGSLWLLDTFHRVDGDCCREAVGALTNGNPAVGATEVDVAVRDGSHADLVKRPCEEGGKGAGKSNGPVTSGTTNCNAHLRKGHWTRTVNSLFISGFQGIICGTSCPKNLGRSSRCRLKISVQSCF